MCPHMNKAVLSNLIVYNLTCLRSPGPFSVVITITWFGILGALGLTNWISESYERISFIKGKYPE